MTKTYEECLEIISRRDYNRDWKDTYLLEGYPTIVQKMKEAALLYGESKFNEGAEEQMRNCCDYAFQAADAPKPTFKP